MTKFDLPPPRVLGRERVGNTSYTYLRDIVGYSAEDVQAILAAAHTDAQRYRWLRQQHWSDDPMLGVVARPQKAVRLGHECPSLERLDAAIDTAMRVEAPPTSSALAEQDVHDPNYWCNREDGRAPVITVGPNTFAVPSPYLVEMARRLDAAGPDPQARTVPDHRVVKAVGVPTCAGGKKINPGDALGRCFDCMWAGKLGCPRGDRPNDPHDDLTPGADRTDTAGARENGIPRVGLEPNGGNVNRPHLLQISSGVYWRCAHGKTGYDADMNWIGCKECDAAGVASRKEQIDAMVNRFLGWKLPRTFSPDAGVKFTPSNGMTREEAYEKVGWWPVGTNLLTADEARAMFEHALGVPAVDPWQRLAAQLGLDGWAEGRWVGPPTPEQIITHVLYIQQERARLLAASLGVTTIQKGQQ